MPKFSKSSSSRNGPSHSSSLVPEPKDPSEAMALGIEAEERGERAAYGSKALRNYQEASRFYSLALRLDPQGDEAADAAYNAGRVLFLIGSGFVMLNGKIKVFEESVEFYRRAAQLEESKASSSSSSPTSFMLDIASNLAAALQAWAETLMSLGDDGDSQRSAALLAQEAYQIYDTIVAKEQESVLSGQLKDEVSVLEGDLSTLETCPSDHMSAGQDTNFANGEGSSSSEYTSSLIVPSSLLETYHSLHSILLDILLPLASSVGEVEVVQQRMKGILARAEDFAGQCKNANEWGDRASPNGEWTQGLSQLGRDSQEGDVAVMVALADLYFKAADEEARVNLISLCTPIVEVGKARLSNLQAILSPTSKEEMSVTAATLPESRRRNYYQMKVDEALSCAEQAVTLARTLLRLLSIQNNANSGEISSSTLLRLSWSLATSSSQVYLLILSLLDTTTPGGGIAAVLGARASANPTTLLRCQVYTSLSSVCLLRANERYASPPPLKNNSRPAAIPAIQPLVSESSRRTILDNARVYAQRGLSEVGLGFLYDSLSTTSSSSSSSSSSTSTSSSSPTTSNISAKAQQMIHGIGKEIQPGGWDAIETMAESIYALLRAIYIRSTFSFSSSLSTIPSTPTPTPTSTSTSTPTSTGREELTTLSKNMRGLMTFEGWDVALDLQRVLRGVVEEEGGMEEDEVLFWREWGSSLLSD